MSRIRQEDTRGGGYRTLAATPTSAQARPQHAVDVALAQAALGRARATVARAAANGRPSAQAASFYRLIKQFCRDLARQPFSTMSDGQRRVCERVLGEEQVSAVRARAIATLGAATSVLDLPLPMKPPPRRADPED